MIDFNGRSCELYSPVYFDLLKIEFRNIKITYKNLMVLFDFGVQKNFYWPNSV